MTSASPPRRPAGAPARAKKARRRAPPSPPSREVEPDHGFDESHGYGPGHGGPSGPGDVPAAPSPDPAQKPPADDDDEI